MKTRKSLGVLVVLTLGSYAAVAQHSHGGSMGHDTRLSDRYRIMRIQGTEEQRQQFNEYAKFAETMRSQFEAIASAKEDAKAEYLRSEKDQAQSALEALDRSYQTFTTGLADEQRDAVKKQLSQMDKARAELASNLKELDGELARPTLDAKRISDYGKKLQKAIGKWENNQRKVGAMLSFTS